MLVSGHNSYVLAVVLALLLHAGLAAILITYHDQLARIQLNDREPLKLKMFNPDFEPIAIRPVQSRLIVEKEPPQNQTADEQQQQQSEQQKTTKVKKKSLGAKKKNPAPPSKSTTKTKIKPDPIDTKIRQLQDLIKNKLPTPVQKAQIQDSPEIRIAKRHVGRIQKQIEKNWTKPLNVQYRELEGLKVLIRLLLTPAGILEKAEIMQSSGNSQFDRSALNAVYKTGRFQVPGDVAIFQRYFRNLTISYNL